MPDALKIPMSPEAEDRIFEKLIFGEDHIPDKTLVPALCPIYSRRLLDKTGRLTGFYGNEFVEIGWYDPQIVEAGDFRMAKVRGKTIFIPLYLAKKLKKGRLVVRTISFDNGDTSEGILEVQDDPCAAR